MAEELVDNSMVLPVIDGLDELTSINRSEFLTRLNESLGATDPLILTCRSIEYADAVADADVLTAAAVIEAGPLTPSEAADYLDRCLPPRRRHDWEPILDHLRHHHRSPIAETSSTPLGLWLLRTVYIENKRDPAPLCATDLFPDTATLKGHLFDELITAVIAKRQPIPGERGLLQPRRQWSPEDVHRWLTYLAVHLNGERDLRWWAMPTLAPFATRMIVVLAGVLVFGLAFSLVSGMRFDTLGFDTLGDRTNSGATSKPGFGAAVGLSIAVAAGSLFTVMLSAAIRATPEPGYAQTQLRGRVRHLARCLTAGLGTGLLLGLVAGLIPDAVFVLTYRQPHWWNSWRIVTALVGLLTAALAGSAIEIAAYIISAGSQHIEPGTRIYRRSRGIARDVAVGAAAGIAVMLADSLYHPLVYGDPMYQPGPLLLVGVIVGPAVALACRATIRSIYASGRAKAPMPGFAQDMTIGLAAAFAVRIASAVVNIVPLTWFVYSVSWQLYALAIGTLIGVVGGFVNWVRSPARDDHPRTPLSAYRDSRTLTVVLWSAVVLVVGVVGLGYILIVERHIYTEALTFSTTIGLFSGLVLALWIGRGDTAWLGFITTMLWLAYRHKFPWSTMRFLDDAHRLGLLRSAGAVYQFRHAELQDHLASSAAEATRSTENGAR